MYSERTTLSHIIGKLLRDKTQKESFQSVREVTDHRLNTMSNHTRLKLEGPKITQSAEKEACQPKSPYTAVLSFKMKDNIEFLHKQKLGKLTDTFHLRNTRRNL